MSNEEGEDNRGEEGKIEARIEEKEPEESDDK
jgi:hypothetical protein